MFQTKTYSESQNVLQNRLHRPAATEAYNYRATGQ